MEIGCVGTTGRLAQEVLAGEGVKGGKVSRFISKLLEEEDGDLCWPLPEEASVGEKSSGPKHDWFSHAFEIWGAAGFERDRHLRAAFQSSDTSLVRATLGACANTNQTASGDGWSAWVLDGMGWGWRYGRWCRPHWPAEERKDGDGGVG